MQKCARAWPRQACAKKQGSRNLFLRTGVFVLVALSLAACGGGGGGGGGTSNQVPVADAGTNLTVDEGAAVSLDGSASSDADGSITAYQWTQTGGTAVTLAGANSATASFTAPAVSATDTLIFRLTVTDNGGSTGSDTVSVSVNPVAGMNLSPVADAGPDQTVAEFTGVVLAGGGSNDPDGEITTYAWTQTAGPAVTLDDADTVSPSFAAPDVAAPTDFVFRLVVTDNEGLNSSPDSVTVTVIEPPPTVTVTGKITYDYVPHGDMSGLVYSATEERPVRGAMVEALDATNDNPIAGSQTSTDAGGNYRMQVPSQALVKIRVNARMVRTGGSPTWDFQIRDNGGVIDGNAKPLYALDGSGFNSGIDDWVVNLNADSGWGGNGYTGPRAAAPFAILDAVYAAVALVLSVEFDADFPPLTLNWSPDNSTDFENSIGTTFYDPLEPGESPSGKQIFVLGEEDLDTDEYDPHIVAHEWGHYFEDRFSRSDSLGGSHLAGDLLDIRVAFSEAWANAFSAMALGDSGYKDAGGDNQARVFSFDLEDGSGACESAVTGWYGECTIGEILYDLFDPNDDGADAISMGFRPIFDAMADAQRTTEALTSIFTFASYLRDRNDMEVGAINALLNAGNISGGNGGIDLYGDLETNDGAADGATKTGDVLPLYTAIQANGTQVSNLCSNADQGVFNKLSNRRFLKFTVNAVNTYRFRLDAMATRPAGSTVDPDFAIYGSNGFVAGGFSALPEFEEQDIELAAGDYVLEIWDDNNISFDLAPESLQPGVYCQQVSITPLP